MPTIAELGRLAAIQTVKQASTALVRRIAKGLLSPQTVQRAAQAMPQGSFRFVKNLGRGQFSLADQVVGNIGGTAGQMVRKLPTHSNITPASEYGPLKKIISHYNDRYRDASGGNPIAPFLGVNNKGAFQALAHEAVTPPKALTDRLSDLHPGNFGPNGQILDFGLSNSSSFKPILGDLLSFERQRIDPSVLASAADIKNRGGFDFIANLATATPEVQSLMRPLNQRVDNNIRRFWATPAHQQQAYADHLNATAGPARQRMVRGMMSAAPPPIPRTPQVAMPPRGPVAMPRPAMPRPPVPPGAANAATFVPPVPAAPPRPVVAPRPATPPPTLPQPATNRAGTTTWQDMRLSPAPYALMGGLGAGAGYGAYKGYQALTSK